MHPRLIVINIYFLIQNKNIFQIEIKQQISSHKLLTREISL